MKLKSDKSSSNSSILLFSKEEDFLVSNLFSNLGVMFSRSKGGSISSDFIKFEISCNLIWFG